ncbi:HD domain-containing protein [Pseudoxanthomonas indica]|uniref:Predicted metal-dependent phosphohydrolase, HD superfamily n=1 Tax=Pseudoxanthomonas indica TaxID=428993 RepID=A0A1T5KPE9_9GAMM|nr:N-methyl-D-aspartate receptor NMDAR2C subunit [Pseudoxanthomonas indica]SKC65158.1 Predicted metal-dependent phosphohydrolase, HD superfamily [Pseudoxanthomonas indica]
MDHSLLPSWNRAWHGLAASGDGRAWFAQLLHCYVEPQRHYHTLQHLQECLTHFEHVRAAAAHPHEVEMALWFHDAIYEVRAADNEQRSADWAREVLRGADVEAAAADRVHALIMATRHTAIPSGQDEQLLIDIDLSILGADAERFAEYEDQIRREYAFVPGWLFKRKRRAILSSFLDRPRLYSTALFHDALEQRARANLSAAIAGRRVRAGASA